ncbi:hypothetical protein Apmu_0118_09 [Acidiphilium multivorum AIU301]|nr:hypothetical protein Apmu_0118_09 [Acidiphilium multivorum AIU301]
MSRFRPDRPAGTWSNRIGLIEDILWLTGGRVARTSGRCGGEASIAFIWWVAVEWGGWSRRAGRGGRVALGFQA